MVGEDHSVAALIKEKDSEIAELRARLDDKDRMLAALRTAARSRDNADRVESRVDSRVESRVDSRSEVRISQILDSNPGPAPIGSPPAAPSLLRQVSYLRNRTKSVDEMSKMLDEMIQDRVESGQLVRGVRGSVRVPAEDRPRRSAETPPSLPPPSLPPSMPLSPPVGPPPASSPPPPAGPPIQLQLLARQRASFAVEPQKSAVLEV